MDFEENPVLWYYVMGDVRYFQPIISDGITYSIDMVTLRGSHARDVSVSDFPWSGFQTMPFLDAFTIHLRDFAFRAHFDYQHYDSFTFLTYRDMWVCKGEHGETVKFFFGFRGYDDSGVNSWKVQFNPNKILPCDSLVALIRWMISVSGDCRLVSFDAAADLPDARSDVFLIKDKRKYQLVCNSADDRTEYLGCRGQSGFVKLYNKKLEMKLDYDLTRFELSVDLDDGVVILDLDLLKKSVPSVYRLRRQLDFEVMNVSASDRLLLYFCLEHPDGLLMLDKRKKKTILSLIDRAADLVSFDLLVWIKEFYSLHDLLFGGI